MKQYLLISMAALLMSSCSKTCYQLFETSSNDLTKTESSYRYENNDIVLIYNLWAEFGRVEISVYNKKDINVFLDLGLSHQIANGKARTIFENSEFSYESTVGSSLQVSRSQLFATRFNSTIYNTSIEGGKGSSNSSSITYHEKRIICIPPQSYKIIEGYILQESRYFDCDLLETPKRNEPSVLQFDSENSPLMVRSLISYTLSADQHSDMNMIDNSFWVSSVSNYSYKDFVSEYNPEICGETAGESVVKEFVKRNPARFYIEYKATRYPFEKLNSGMGDDIYDRPSEL